MSGETDVEKRRDQERQKNKMKNRGGIFSEETNPCLKEYKGSLKCMKDNNFVENKCNTYFEEYRNCKKFWATVERDRRAKRIRPLLPPLSEREKIKEEYLNKNIKLGP